METSKEETPKTIINLDIIDSESPKQNAEYSDVKVVNPEQQKAEKYIDNIVENIKSTLGKELLNKNNIIFIVSKVVDSVEKIKKLSGMDKKNIAIGALNKFIKMSDLPSNDKEILIGLVDDLVSPAIDVIVALKKNKKLLCCC